MAKKIVVRAAVVKEINMNGLVGRLDIEFVAKIVALLCKLLDQTMMFGQGKVAVKNQLFA